jgi:hypothetical protein
MIAIQAKLYAAIVKHKSEESGDSGGNFSGHDEGA